MKDEGQRPNTADFGLSQGAALAARSARNGVTRSSRPTAPEGGWTEAARPGATATARNARSLRPRRNELSKSYVGAANGGLGVSEAQKTKSIWDAFGLYIAKQMRSGRGVWVPKFGQFSFTGMHVDLAGSTNPHTRDRQERLPVFVVGKDFVSGVSMRAGIAGGMQEGVEQNYGGAIRPFSLQGTSGIIPKVKINYFEVATLAGGVATKDECRTEVEQIFNNFSSQTRRGQAVEAIIPHVGRLQIRNNLAGIVFQQDLIAGSRGQTAKGYEYLFMGNNWMNNKMFEPNTQAFGKSQRRYEGLRSPTANAQPFISQDAKEWLRDNLDLDLEKHRNTVATSPQQPRVQQGVWGTLRDKATIDNTLANARQLPGTRGRDRDALSDGPYANSKADQRSRALSAYSSPYTGSKVGSQIGSTMSRLPELAPFQLMNLANEIYSVRQALCQAVKGGLTLRDTLSSSKIQSLLSTAGYKVSIGNLKALLKELGFSWNGPACSIQKLLQRLREYLNPEVEPVRYENETAAANGVIPEEADQPEAAPLDNSSKMMAVIKDLFYSTGKTLYQLYRESCSGDQLDLPSFHKTISKYSSGSFTQEDVASAFQAIALRSGGEAITFQQFQDGFRLPVPTPGSHKSETKVIQAVREWMFQRQHATEGAFERLLRSSDRWGQKSLSREDFHRAMAKNQVGLTAPEIDFLFDLLTGQQGTELKLEHWTSKIFDDALNPLQLLRELVQAENVDADDLLFQLKLKAWDEPLAFDRFKKSVSRLDPSFSDAQCRNLFNKLKNSDGLVEVETLLRNVTGSEQDTVDFRNKMYRQIYHQIYAKGKQAELLRQLEQADAQNDGRVAPPQLEKILKSVTGGAESCFTDDAIRKFIRQLQKDGDYKIRYIELMDRICALGNRNHNPLKQLVQRLAYFLESNKLSIANLLRRLGATEHEGVSIQRFAEFLKAKVEKRRELSELQQQSLLLDVDKDGCVGEEDLKTCLNNMQSMAFFDNGGAALSSSQFNCPVKFYPTNSSQGIQDSKVMQICGQLRQLMQKRRVSYLKLFKNCDTDGVGMINLGQFIKGVNEMMTFAAPLLEKVFNIMDSNGIGMVDFTKFERVLGARAASQIPKPGDRVEDSFQWQEDMIAGIRKWAKTTKLNSIEAFRSFDLDFDGLISKYDMKAALQKYLQIRPEEIHDTRLDRLFRLLSFYKCEHIQPSDFERLLNDANPYITASSGATLTNFTKSMGGGFAGASTHDWKFAAIQQIGLLISRKYLQIEDSFLDASKQTDKVNFEKFMVFLDKHNACAGFNLTQHLYQKLFAELDPHKKTFLTLKDWLSAFQSFNDNEHLITELKNFMQCQFANDDSAFYFLQSFGLAQEIDFATFSKAARSMIATRALSQEQLRNVFERIAQGSERFNETQFKNEFKNVAFKGKQLITTPRAPIGATVKTKKTNGKRGKSLGSRDLFENQLHKQTGSTAVSKWEADVIDKLKRLIKSSGKSLDAVFAQFDVDGSGDITATEFRKAMRLISLSLTDGEIDKIMNRVDANMDGVVSYVEFAARFRDDPAFDERMIERATDRLARLKEKMILYMTSPAEAYRMFDSSHSGRLTYLDFDKLVRELSNLSKEPVPCYSVINDMFDAIDSAHDQVIDLREWRQAFGALAAASSKIGGKAKPYVSWENGEEAEELRRAIAKNRKMLIDSFRHYSTHSDHNGESRYVTYEQAKAALYPILREQMAKGKMITDDKLGSILRVGSVVQKHGAQSGTAIYDFMTLMDGIRDKTLGY